MLKTLKAVPGRTYVLIIAALLVIGGGFTLFTELGENVLEKEKFIIDTMAADFISQISTPTMITIFSWITELGSVWFLTAGSIIMIGILWYFYNRNKWRILYFIIAMGGISLLVTGLKLVFSRDRPNIKEQFDGTGYSFPSGHSTSPVVFYGFIIYLIMRSKLNHVAKWLINGLLVVLILAIAISRLPLEVHYFTDVLGGLSLGTIWLVTCISILEFTLWRSGKKLKTNA